MVRHKGGKLSKAAKNLQNPSTSKKVKSKAAKILKKHQDEKH
ncbi:hypothetical protein [Sutcliffiella horikoshii]